MFRTRVMLVILTCAVAACGGKSTTSPSTSGASTVVFTAVLLPSNEVPAVSNADSAGSGTATVTLKVTRDTAGNVTSATTTFQIALTGFPANTNLTGAHIHEGGSGANGAIKVSTTLANGELVLGNGTGAFVKADIATTADVAQGILNNPAGYYFNVHTTLNAGGAARGQLIKQQ